MCDLSMPFLSDEARSKNKKNTRPGLLWFPARQASLPRVRFLSDELTTTDDN
jgi:hypothetical protein